MKNKIEKMREDCNRRFPISEDELPAIEKWKKNHDKKVHGLTTKMSRIKADCVCGGRYSYVFIPTSIGVSGTIRCSCNADFEFQKLG